MPSACVAYLICYTFERATNQLAAFGRHVLRGLYNCVRCCVPLTSQVGDALTVAERKTYSMRTFKMYLGRLVLAFDSQSTRKNALVRREQFRGFGRDLLPNSFDNISRGFSFTESTQYVGFV